jgi:hypothetical protein
MVDLVRVKPPTVLLSSFTYCFATCTQDQIKLAPIARAVKLIKHGVQTYPSVADAAVHYKYQDA